MLIVSICMTLSLFKLVVSLYRICLLINYMGQLCWTSFTEIIFFCKNVINVRFWSLSVTISSALNLVSIQSRVVLILRETSFICTLNYLGLIQFCCVFVLLSRVRLTQVWLIYQTIQVVIGNISRVVILVLLISLCTRWRLNKERFCLFLCVNS